MYDQHLPVFREVVRTGGITTAQPGQQSTRHAGKTAAGQTAYPQFSQGSPHARGRVPAPAAFV